MNNRHSLIPIQCLQLLMISLLLGSLSSCGSSREFSDIAPGDAEEMIRQNIGNSDFVLLDVRTDGEFQSGHLDGAVNLDIQLAGFTDAIEKLPKDKTYLVYCRSGGRSGRAMKMMKEKGFVSIYNLQGGITKWKAENHPMEIR
ncbi:MAG TPA: rhodanese-like domain-containing protein [Bacteroidetes bacterium]|nr:rhodanese-like domain-containing protein [Bacteroidota bacterium]